MEMHIRGTPEQVSRNVFCPGSQPRARAIADHFQDRQMISDDRGMVVYSGVFEGVYMTACGTGISGPATAIACEELAHLGADTFIRVGSCGLFQPGQRPVDEIIANGTVRLGGTGSFYLPVEYPAVPTFAVTRALVEAAEGLGLPVTVGVGLAGDGFYEVEGFSRYAQFMQARPLFIEMESDALFLVGAVRVWRAGALFSSDGSPDEIKPDWGRDLFRQGVQNSIRIALTGMLRIAGQDAEVR